MAMAAYCQTVGASSFRSRNRSQPLVTSMLHSHSNYRVINICGCLRFTTSAVSLEYLCYTSSGKRKLSSITSFSEGGGDAISLLNERIRREHTKRDFPSSRPSVEFEEADKYVQLVKEQQQRGLQKLKGGNANGTGDAFSYKVNPHSLHSGDYVVHKRVGIGRFVGVKFDVPNGSLDPIEYVYIEFADGMAKLPVRQASRVLYRYNLPSETKKPRTLSKLSDTSAWERRRTKGKVAVQKMVVDLMELYLHRLKQKRPPYPISSTMSEFASQFQFEPTPDQKQAFMDVERDLTKRETPMDRLICGDVGFGKTEVALRAIFCVVSAGKQAMILAPTIVLAKQHFDVISERFSSYPDIKIGLLSRFQTKLEKEAHLNMIKHGDLDIIVGTHSLLGNRVVYSNLGLLVVDEEQRFGVKQKERIASFKSSVDVLTLSATPIPRTLYLALTGFRDASLISTPPPERVPIRTHLFAFTKDKVIAAIKYELDRGGQVFYVLPRIKGLEMVMEFLEEHFPHIEIAIAHGKQNSRQLEDTMEKFCLGHIKVLICTNIVESGLDIQNANTIIIQEVQQFGLAQLYQLRGRVGRADKEAHAFLFYPDKSLLSDQALERLSALEDCRDLGQGFHLAERDMAIRGFGNIFGEQQTGDVGNVGIDLFFEMLFESLSKVDEHRVVPVSFQSVQFDMNLNHHLPSEYINYLENPLKTIKEAEKAAEKDMWELVQFTENLRRQYGKEPYSMEIILKKLYVRRMSADLGITNVYASGKMVCMKTNMSEKVFRLIRDSMVSEVLRNSLIYEDGSIKAILLLELPREQLLNWIFQCFAELNELEDLLLSKAQVRCAKMLFVVSTGKLAMILAPTIVLVFDVISESCTKDQNIKIGTLVGFRVDSEQWRTWGTSFTQAACHPHHGKNDGDVSKRGRRWSALCIGKIGRAISKYYWGL